MRLLRVIGVFALAWGAGCSPPSDDPDLPPPYVFPPSEEEEVEFEVLATNPPDLAEDVSSSLTLVINFSKDLVISTVSAGTILFDSPSGPLDGTFTAVGANVYFILDTDMVRGSWIDATVTTSVRALDGDLLEEPYTWRFRTEDGPQLVASAPGIQRPRIAASAGGLVVTTWSEGGTGSVRLMARHHLPETGWAAPVEIDGSMYSALNLFIRCTSDNQAVALWLENESGVENLRTARFTEALGWGTPETLGTGVALQTLPKFSMSPEGWGAAWYGNPSTFRYLDQNGLWQAPAAFPYGFVSMELGVAGDGVVYAPYVSGAINPATGSTTFRGAVFVAATGWTEAIIGSVAYNVPVDVAADATSALVMLRYSQMVRSWRVVGGAWTPLADFNIGGPTAAAANPKMSRASAGDGCLAWNQLESGATNAWGAWLNPAGGWESSQILESDANVAGPPAVVAAGNGDQWVAFSQFNGTGQSIFRVRFVAGSGWEAPQPLDDDTYESREPLLSAGGGLGGAVWLRFNTDLNRDEVMATILD